MHGSGRTSPADARLARYGAPLVVLVILLIDVLPLISPSHSTKEKLLFGGLLLGETLIASVVGMLVVRRHPRHPVGWLLVAHGLLVALVLGGSGASTHFPGSDTITQIGLGSWCLLYICLAAIGYVFPTGRFLSRRWRRFAIGTLAGYGVFMVGASADLAGYHAAGGRGSLPLPTLPQVVSDVLGVAGLLAIIASLVGSVVCARSRLKQADGEERLQLLWFVWAALTIPAALATCFVDQWITGGAGTLTLLAVTVFGSVLPLAIGVAILRSGLFDIELVLSRTLTYATLTVLVVATYAGALGGAKALLDNGSAAGLVAVAVIAVLIQPVHARVRRAAERMVYGDRSDPYAALRRLSDRLEASADSAQVVTTVTTSVAEALRVDYVEVALDSPSGPATTTRHGTPGRGSLVTVPLAHRGERLGELSVEVQRGRELSTSERDMLDDLARHAGTVMRAVHLTLDLQQSRARLVTAQEEERRRLRRDLHDGLGPSLAAIVLKLNAVSSMVSDEQASPLLDELRSETRAAIAEIRRVVEGLRPPALDEVGLLAALRQKAATLTRTAPHSASGLVIDVLGPDVLPALPAAVEVAVYRIATEAMTNVVRHSSATRCVVSLSSNGALEVLVTDNGTGPSDRAQPGVGWSSMRERAAELGGSCTVARRTEGGTVVRAVLPLPRHDEAHVRRHAEQT